MIFYFSGTGNSQLVAKRIAKNIDDEIISINECLKKKQKKSFHSESPLIFVAPTYAWRIPRVTEQWILKNQFTGNRNAYFVLTCGGDCGNAITYAKKLCAKKKMHFCGLVSIVMPENYVAMFATPNEKECNIIIEKAKPYIDELSAQIQSGKQLPETSISFKSKVLSGPINQIYYPLLVHDKGFRVSDTCISCGKCAKRCPLGNISMVNKKPIWKGTCTHCMACIGGCPTKAIEYKSKSKGQHRYYIMEE